MNNFSFFLDFVSLGFTETYQITEPVGFDGANFVVKQKENMYARDIYKGCADLDLTFEHVSAEIGDKEQCQDISGNTSVYLDMGLNWIFETKKRFGFNGKINFILKKDGLDFSFGQLDLGKNFKTDGYTYFSCKIIQINKISDYKKHDETVINILGTRNVKNEIIEPAKTLTFLRKATTTSFQSEWNSTNTFNENQNAIGTSVDSEYFYYFNNCRAIIKSEIKNTLTPFLESVKVPSFFEAPNTFYVPDDFILLTSKFTNTDLRLDFENLSLIIDTDTDNGGDGFCNGGLFVKWGFKGAPEMGVVQLIDWYLEDGQSYQSPNTNYSVTIPILPIGASVWVYFKNKVVQSSDFAIFVTPRFESFVKISAYKLKVSSFSTGLNTVVKGVRYIDMMRQCSAFINNLPINAERFDFGGEFYNQVCFNRNLISQKLERPFNTNFKEILGSVIEVNGDYEIKEDEIFVGQMPDYYINQEIGVFQEIPSKEYLSYWNPKFLLNKFRFGWKNFEKNRNSKYTAQDIHTSSEWIVPNEGVENIKEVSLELIRSNYSQQAIVDLETSNPQTADENDDKVYITSILELPKNTKNTFSFFLAMYVNDGMLILLNKTQESSSEDVAIDWLTQGLSIGQLITLSESKNNGIYKVLAIERERLFLDLNANNPSFSGDSPVMISYIYQNLDWQIRTDQDMQTEGIPNPSNYGNLLFSIKRNMIHWQSYLNTSCFFFRDGVIRNSFFKNNPKTKTKLISDNLFLDEIEDLNISSLKDRFLNTENHEIIVYCSFKDILGVLEKLKSTRGFVRIIGISGNVIKGFIQKLDYNWNTSELKLTLEGKFETDILTLAYQNKFITVNDVIYELNGELNWWRLTKDYFQAFDSNNIAICNQYRFDFVSLNGTIFANPNELVTALKLLEL